ncbi:MAG TPA: hypothetical protein VK849_02305 [Longimicrobiales bacterium]|nr:hypothetical protein [Longimicrobiales bacterium]
MSSEDQVRPFHAKVPEQEPEARGQEAADAVAAVMKHAAERDEAARRKSRARPHPRWMLPLGLNLSVLALYLLIAPPDWVVIDPIPAPEPARQAEDLRVAMYLQAKQIEAYRIEHGRLPTSLADAGTPVPGVDYVPQGVTFLLIATSGDGVLRYDSNQSADSFIGSAASRLAGG